MSVIKSKNDTLLVIVTRACRGFLHTSAQNKSNHNGLKITHNYKWYNAAVDEALQ